MKIIVFGGDGFCGWPTSLHLSDSNHEVMIVDNLSRREIDRELGVQSLTPIAPIEERLKTWEQVSGKIIDFRQFDLSKNYLYLLEVLDEFKPDAVVHFAEQRSAPYSMKSPKHKRYTVNNNVNATNNLLAAVVESGQDIHIVHLGTMGVYGYGTPGVSLPEGYLKVWFHPHGSPTEILYPTNPGSVYHMTKVLDQDMFAYYNKNDNLRITDLHQGIVWGTQTTETKKHTHLINRFDYDGDYGTVLNRFLMQAAIKYPLTVHGTGGQTRAFIHITDTVKCVRFAIENPPKPNRVRIFNQMAEILKVRDLAVMISQMTGATVQYLDNPRNEAAENELAACNLGLQMLGLDATLLGKGLMEEIVDIASKYSDRCDKSKILCTSRWKK